MVRDLRLKRGGRAQRKRCSCSQKYQQGLLGNSSKVCMVRALGEDGSLNTQLISLNSKRKLKSKQQACVHTNPYIFIYVLYSWRIGRIWCKLQWHTNYFKFFGQPSCWHLPWFLHILQGFLGQALYTPHLQQRKKSKKRRQHLLCTNPSWAAATAWFKAQMRAEEEQGISYCRHPTPYKTC